MLIDGKQLKDGSITADKLASDTFAVPTQDDKNLVALVTALDFDKATNSTVTTTPVGDSNVAVDVNGASQVVGDGVKTNDCYFSGDAGATARAISDIVAGDELFWVGSVAGFELAATDRIDFIYDI